MLFASAFSKTFLRVSVTSEALNCTTMLVVTSVKAAGTTTMCHLATADAMSLRHVTALIVKVIGTNNSAEEDPFGAEHVGWLSTDALMYMQQSDRRYVGTETVTTTKPENAPSAASWSVCIVGLGTKIVLVLMKAILDSDEVTSVIMEDDS